MNVPQEFHSAAAMPIEETLRYAASLAEALRQMHKDGSACGRLDTNQILWDNHTVSLIQNGAGGSDAYLAPEQLRAEVADARSDIFAFGAILYQLLAGRRAFPADEPEELKRQILESAPPPIPAIPDGIESLLNRCLEKNRDLRWQRMNSILIELKLAKACVRQAHAASAWKEEFLWLRAQATAQDKGLSETQQSHESAVEELRTSIQRVEAAMAGIQESIAGLQRGRPLNAKAIEGLQVAASQTDEVVGHVVEAFGMMHKSITERGEGKV